MSYGHIVSRERLGLLDNQVLMEEEETGVFR